MLLFNVMNTFLVYSQQFLIKGWSVSILLLLSFLLSKNSITLTQLGILSSISVFTSILFALLGGNLARRYGTKVTLFSSLLTYVLAWGIASTTNNILALIAAFALVGIGSGISEVLGTSVIAKSCERNKRTSSIANLGAVGDLGRIGLSALTSTLLVLVGTAVLARGYFVVAIIAALVFLLLFKQSDLRNVSNSLNEKSNIKTYLTNKQYVWALVAGMLDSFANSSLFIFLPILLALKGIDFGKTGMLTTLFFFGYLAGRILLGRLSDKHGTVRVLMIGEIIMALAIFGVVLSQGIIVIAILMFIMGFAARGTSPITKAMSTDALDPDVSFENGIGLFLFGSGISSVLSKSTFGFIASTFGITSVFIISALAALSVSIPAVAFNKGQKED